MAEEPQQENLETKVEDVQGGGEGTAEAEAQRTDVEQEDVNPPEEEKKEDEEVSFLADDEPGDAAEITVPPEEDNNEAEDAYQAAEEEKEAETAEEVPVTKEEIKPQAIQPDLYTKEDTESVKLLGDFTVKKKAGFLKEGEEDEKSTIMMALEEEKNEEEEEKKEEESEPEEEEPEELDREPYYKKYAALLLEQQLVKRKNNFLQRKMAEYYKKRRMDHVLKESDHYEENLIRYQSKLDAYGELKDLEEREVAAITQELNEMLEEKDENKSKLDENFNSMQSRMRQIGIGLIMTKTGKQIPDKLVERYLKQQKSKTVELAGLRLGYMKLRDQISEKQSALDQLDKVGDNFYLIDYEQLKIENRNHADKIEERDEELSKLRTKCIAAIDCLAHVREKSAEVQLEITEKMEQLDAIKREGLECRERVNYFKQERDNTRAEIEKLKEESGLLTKPKLLCDMEVAIRELDSSQKELDDIVSRYEKNKEIVTQIKLCIEDIEEKLPYYGIAKNETKQSSLTKKPSLIDQNVRKDSVKFDTGE